jgi:hypothetical protein
MNRRELIKLIWVEANHVQERDGVATEWHSDVFCFSRSGSLVIANSSITKGG